MRQQLQVKSDWTVRALSAELQSVGINVSHDTVWRFLRSEGKTFKKTLVPTLKVGDIDNLGSHKGKPARDAIRNVGAHLFFLPPYSPALNPSR